MRFAVLLAFSALAADARAQLRPAPRLIGIYDAQTGSPIEGAQLRDGFTGTYALTTNTGTASLGFLTYKGQAAMLTVSKLGYQPEQVMLDRADTVAITMVLERVSDLPAMVTTATYRLDLDAGVRGGFSQRCTVKHVSCFPANYITTHPSRSLPDILKNADGIKVRCGGAGTNAARSRGRTDQSLPSCMVTNNCIWFVDGIQAPVVAKALQAPDIQAIEVYQKDGPSPPRFAPYYPYTCSIVIWAK